MNGKVESFWDKDVLLFYDCRVAVGLIGGYSMGEALAVNESVRIHCNLPLLNKPREYYIDRYKSYCLERGIRFDNI